MSEVLKTSKWLHTVAAQDVVDFADGVLVNLMDPMEHPIKTDALRNNYRIRFHRVSANNARAVSRQFKKGKKGVNRAELNPGQPTLSAHYRGNFKLDNIIWIENDLPYAYRRNVEGGSKKKVPYKEPGYVERAIDKTIAEHSRAGSSTRRKLGTSRILRAARGFKV